MKITLSFFLTLITFLSLSAQVRYGVDTTCLRQYEDRAKALFKVGEQQAAGAILFDSVRHCAIGTYLPDSKLIALDGNAIRTDTIQKNLLLSFTASWCGPCEANRPALNRLAAENRNDLLIVMIYWDDRDYVAEVADDYHENIVLVPSKEEAAPTAELTYDAIYHPYGYPTTYAIDRNKQIKEVVIGAATPRPARDDQPAITEADAHDNNYERLIETIRVFYQ